MLIDCHAHLADPSFDPDRATVLERAARAGIGDVLVVGEGPEHNLRVQEVCGQETGGVRLLPCFGFHPDHFADDRPLPTREDTDVVLSQIREAAPSLVAIGEVGLDRRVATTEDRRRAQEEFLAEIATLAGELDLPLNVHSRSAGHYTLDVLREAGAKRVLMHAFDGKASYAVRAAGEGFLFSIPPSIVRSQQKQKLVAALPLDVLLLESDSPVLGPERDQRNEPANIARARDAIAEIHGVSSGKVDEITTGNARRLLGLAS